MVLLGLQLQAPDYCCLHTQASSHFLAFNTPHTAGMLGQLGIRC